MRYLAAIRRDLGWRRFAFAAGIAAVAATQVLFQPDLLGMWDLADVLLALGRYALELGVIAAALTVAFTLVDHLPIASTPLRVAAFGGAYLGASFLAVGGIGAVEFYPRLGGWPVQLTLAEALRWTLLAGFVSAILLMHRATLSASSLARAIEETREALKREQLAMQLQLLQAQIEPHFLFNTLANMRRLYRTQPDSGAQMIDSLLRYLRAALPQMRQGSATLGDELELIRAYLELVRIRMGFRLRYSIHAEPALVGLPFPPMLLMTLVENAVKHGLELAPNGGGVDISAYPVDGSLQVTVADDGLGLGGAQTGGTGVGLANIRRQLALRFGADAALSIAERVPHGVVCSMRLPLPAGPVPGAARALLAAAG